MLEHHHSLPRTVMIQYYCYMYVGIEILKICRDWFYRLFSTVIVVAFGNITVTVPYPCLLIFCLTTTKETS